MRVVVFSADPGLESTPWWNALVTTPGISAILLCSKERTTNAGTVLRGLQRNIRKHGLVWVPYRAGVLALAVLRRAWPRRVLSARSGVDAPIERVRATNLHAPDVIARVTAFRADLGVSLGAPVLKRSLFALPRLGTINMHLGKVPEFRGAPVGFWELDAGVPSVGATIHWIDEGLDTGPIIAGGEATIYARDRLDDVQRRAGELGSELLATTLTRIISGTHTARPQAGAVGPANTFPTLRQRAALGWRSLRRRSANQPLSRRVAKGALVALALYGFRPLRDLLRTLCRAHPVHVFTFHRVTELCRDGMTVSPPVFAEQIRYIARHHDLVSLDQALTMLRDGARLARPAAVITFDDGYHSVFTAARPVLAQYGAPGVCFITTDLVGTTGAFPHDADSPVREHLRVMSWADLRQLHRDGWAIESHTATHPRVSAIHGSDLRHELEEPRHALRRELDVPADVLAYPFGAASDFSDEALLAAKELGYRAIFANHKGENHPAAPAEILARIDLGGDHGSLAWKMLSHGIDLGQLRPRVRPSSDRAAMVAVVRT